MKTPTKRRGYTLMELLCVMGLLGVLGLVMAILLREVIRVERTQTQGFDRLLQSQTLADQFRADVADAQSSPQAWEQFKADAHTLILQRQNGERIIYRWQAGQLQRLTFEDRAMPKLGPSVQGVLGVAAVPALERRAIAERALPVGGKQVGVEFVRDGVYLMRLRLQTLRDGSPAPGQTLEIAAAVGGDWR